MSVVKKDGVGWNSFFFVFVSLFFSLLESRLECVGEQLGWYSVKEKRE